MDIITYQQVLELEQPPRAFTLKSLNAWDISISKHGKLAGKFHRQISEFRAKNEQFMKIYNRDGASV